jgi:hypothetical protein
MATKRRKTDCKCHGGRLLPVRGPLLGFVLIASSLSLLGGYALAESLFQTPGNDSNNVMNRHTRANGKPCIDVKSFTKAEIVNNNVFEHWIAATNSCGQHIALQVCYRQSSSCILMKVPPWETKNSVLGISSMNGFQFDAREK